jgi:thiosulfate/3-mercaptopyruvate sulfurtransferase
MTLTLNTPLVSTQWLAEHNQDADIRILDCSLVMQPNEDGSYGFVSGIGVWKESHIPNSIYVDVGAELSDQTHEFTLMMPDPEALVATLKQKGIGDDTAVICYDRSNHAWAARVWWMLRVCGFDNAAVLDGGWKKWLAENREVSTELTSYPSAATFTLKHKPELIVNKQEVRAACDDSETLLLHSLPLPLFNGDVSPYKRAGRIPGSKNLYCETLIDPDSNCYLTKEELRQKFSASESLKKERVITYCGGGIAASANALALTLAGQNNVAVYDGSLTEWTADPDMPMETGQPSPDSE